MVKLYGPKWSAYTRTAWLTLIEKEVDHEIVEVDFSGGEMPTDHLKRHPFARVPVLQHGDYSLYETVAICRYIDTAFTGVSLQPEEPAAVGRMTQIIAILDAYLSDAIRMGFVTELLVKPMMAMVVDHERANSARDTIEAGFIALDACLEGEEFMVGKHLSLADLHAVPLFHYLAITRGGSELIESRAALSNWWAHIKTRDSIVATQPDLSVFNKRQEFNDSSTES